MGSRVLSYTDKNTWIHRLSGVTKLVFFLMWSITSMITYDTRVLAVMLIFSIYVLKASKTEWKQVGTVFKFILLFLVINIIAIYIFSPYQGTKVYGTKTVLVDMIGNHDLTREQLFYEGNIILKYMTVVPAVPLRLQRMSKL